MPGNIDIALIVNVIVMPSGPGIFLAQVFFDPGLVDVSNFQIISEHLAVTDYRTEVRYPLLLYSCLTQLQAYGQHIKLHSAHRLFRVLHI